MVVAKAKLNKERGKRLAGALNFQPISRHTTEHNSWFRGDHTNFLPHRKDLYSLEGVESAVLHGHRPDQKYIEKSSKVTAFGSCFAAHISDHLAARNFSIAGSSEDEKSSYVIKCGEGMVNTFVLRQQFEWAWEDRSFDQALWHGYDKEEYGYDKDIQAATKRIFDSTDVFILTVGLSEVWYDDVTGDVFWRTIPKSAYDPDRHKFRMSTVQENTENLNAIRALIKKHRPDAHVIVTLSPVPLIATFQDQSCLVSNSVSKATLRLAVEDVVVNGDDQTHYWPSYELVNDVFSGSMLADMRHPHPQVIKFIMYLFEYTWCETDLTMGDLEQQLLIALADCNYMPKRASQAGVSGDSHFLNRLANRNELDSFEPQDENMKSLLARVISHIEMRKN